LRILLHNEDVVEVGLANSTLGPEVVHINANGKLLSFTKRYIGEVPDFLGFLHRHPKMETELKVDDKHVIVDKKDWERVRTSWGLETWIS
jgi:hypothetical protein